MYPVSQAYINKLKAVDIKRRRIRGSVDNIPFTENDILAASFKYSDIAVNSSDIKLGGVFVSTLQLTFLDSFASRIARGTWRGRTITATIGLQIDHQNDTWEDVPIKPYTIDEANHTALGVDVIAYDAMARFDEDINLTNSVGTMYGFLYMATQACNVPLGMTEEQIEDLPNGSDRITLTMDNDIETWRDLISEIATAAGGFATINRTGALEIRQWQTEPALTIGINDRFTGGSWSDFSTKYTALKVGNTDTGDFNYYAIEPDNGLTMDIGSNPLLQAELESTRTRQRMEVLQAIQALQYVPFKSASLIDPAIDLGDVIQYTEGLAAGARCCVMRIDFSFNTGATLQGYGKNPAMQNTKTAQDKRIAQAANKSKENGLTYYNFSNAEEIEINSEEETTIISVDFATAAPTTVTMLHGIKMLNQFTEENQTVKLFFYFDRDKIAMEPWNTYSEAGTFHYFPSFYTLLNVMNETAHEWKVTAQTSTGTAVVAIDDAKATLMGQKLVATDEWIGMITPPEELYTPIQAGAIIGEYEDITEGPKKGEPTGSYRTTVDGNTRTTVDGNARTYIAEE